MTEVWKRLSKEEGEERDKVVSPVEIRAGMIPDDVIEAMVEEINIYCCDDYVGRFSVRAALAAAEAKGWKLVPREPTLAAFDCDPVISMAARLNHGIPWHWPVTRESGYVPGKIWRAVWDAAPSAKEGK